MFVLQYVREKSVPKSHYISQVPFLSRMELGRHYLFNTLVFCSKATTLDNSNSVIRRNPVVKLEISAECTSVTTMPRYQSQKDKMREELQLLHNDMAHKKNVYIS